MSKTNPGESITGMRLHDQLGNAFRRWGYLQADLDPMDRIRRWEHPDITDHSAGARAQDVEHWRSRYCGSIGFEYMHMVDRERVEWMINAVESSSKPEVKERWILERLMNVELFEGFLHSRYVGSKRFSIDGVAGLVTLLDSVLNSSAELGAQFLYLGMSHRGRLNIMKNVVMIPGADVFAGLEDVDPHSVLGSGDVKYHLGATGRYETYGGRGIEVHLATNPSHLEAVDPVVMGRVRARQERWGDNGTAIMLPITIHGDAAFCGQGVTSEALNFSGIDGYSVGGTIQIIVNNVVGFTAEAAALFTGNFASDAAKRLSIPIIHVNGEDPLAIWWVGHIAAQYRYQFGSDIVVDILGFRRHGHSEVEDPTTTQPLLYAKIKEHPRLWEKFSGEIGESKDVIKELKDAVMMGLSEHQEKGRAYVQRPQLFQLPGFWGRYYGGRHDDGFELETGVDADRLQKITERLVATSHGFNVHPKVQKLLSERVEMTAGNRPVDWGMGEALALGSLLWDGYPVRLSGQDTRRGTFNHRHAALIDTVTGASYVPLKNLHDEQAPFTVLDSPLSEAAAMGFEYGYSREFPDGLVIWEAQFGDFANGAQVVIDQYLCAAEDKWRLLTGLVLLLPHGYEGQGPEHSSARVERFLQLCGEDNIQVCQPSTSGQYFHMLRRQVLRDWRKPLIVFMPKSVLRAPASCSGVVELTTGRFLPVIPDNEVEHANAVIICSGKIVHELRAERKRVGATDRAIVALEQLHPFPEGALRDELRKYQSANKILWVQEEPANMGALSYMRTRLRPLVGDKHVTSVKRSESASPSTGSVKAHALEQKALLSLAFA